MKRTKETSEQFWARTKREISKSPIPAVFTYAWWLEHKRGLVRH